MSGHPTQQPFQSIDMRDWNHFRRRLLIIRSLDKMVDTYCGGSRLGVEIYEN